jgi:hypothetical protein
MGNPIQKAERVRIEMTLAGGTVYEIELTNADELVLGMGELSAELSFEVDTVRRPDDLGAAWTELPTGNATVKLQAHGKLIKTERRAVPPA